MLFQWLGKQSYIDDLTSLDPELYQGLMFLKHYSGNPEELALNFTVTQEGLFSYLSRFYQPTLFCRVWSCKKCRANSEWYQYSGDKGEQVALYLSCFTLQAYETDQASE
jgi:hypothetical protein